MKKRKVKKQPIKIDEAERNRLIAIMDLANGLSQLCFKLIENQRKAS
jgi:hypothetical protein